MSLDWLVAKRVVASGVAELVAGHSGVVVVAAVVAGADADSDAVGPQLLVVHCVELASELVVVRVLAFVHFDEFVAGLVVGGRVD